MLKINHDRFSSQPRLTGQVNLILNNSNDDIISELLRITPSFDSPPTSVSCLPTYILEIKEKQE